MRAAVVHDPEDALGGVVGCLAHDLIDQSLKRLDAGRWFAAAKQLDPMHVHCGEVCPSATALVLVLDAHRLFRRARQARMSSNPRLDAGLLVGRDDELVLAQRRASQRRPYRSRMRSALRWNCGSRGKIQQRCCHGRIASSCSQRQMVLPLMLATRPERCACSAMSLELNRDSGKPRFAGISQASALISTTSSGGKSPGASRAGSLLEPRYSISVEALAPLADDLAARIQAHRDLIVVHALGGHQDHLGPNYLEVRQRISTGAPAQLLRLGARQRNTERAISRHHAPPAPGRYHDAIRART